MAGQNRAAPVSRLAGKQETTQASNTGMRAPLQSYGYPGQTKAREHLSGGRSPHLSEAHSDMQTTLALLCSLSEVRMLLTGEPCLLMRPVRPALRPPVTGAMEQLRIMGWLCRQNIHISHIRSLSPIPAT